jgi:polysaccharide deacetylase 2 family uncharacterized protein YibQ
VKKSGNSRIREPRKGALVVTLVVILAVVCVLAAYFLLVPSRKTTVLETKKPVVPNNASTAKPKPAIPSVPVPPFAEQKPAGDSPAQQKTGKTPKDDAPPQNLKSGTGRLAIIIDDMGTSVSEARSLSAIGVTLNFSIIPGLRNYREVAQFADSKGIETLVHIPMQSKGWPGRRLEANGLLVSMDSAELKGRVSGFLNDIPGAVGANNHMGSEFTEKVESMRPVLETLKSKNLFFVDSVTSTQTVGLSLARELGMKTGRRNVFLDNEQERGYILGQLAQAVKLAKKSGSAIAICHPHPETIATLASALPGLAAQGVTLVPVSQLVR